MKKYLLMFLLYLSIAVNAFADSDSYGICSTGGFFGGTNNKFMSGITAHIISRKEISNNAACIKLYNQAFKLGRKIAAGDNINNPQEIKIINKANDFRAKVYNTISTQMGY